MKERPKIEKPLLPHEHGDDWIDFNVAAWKIEKRLSVSVGVSEKMLRDLCASGEVRSIRVEYIYLDDVDRFAREEGIFIRPSEWQTGEVDYEGLQVVGEGLHIEVSQDDLEWWLEQRGEAPRPDPRDTAIANQLGLKPRPPWKRLCDNVRKECEVTANTRGYSDETIERRAKEMLRTGGHFGQPIMTDMT
jgi:hypothetical protein